MGQSSPGPIYQTFRVAGADDNYRLTIGEGEGTGFDAMADHNNREFTTYEVGICAFRHQGGWWYSNCYYSNLNGPHTVPSIPGVSPQRARLMWFHRLVEVVI